MTRNDIVIENAHIAFRNFEGREGTFNNAGKRNFCVVFDKETAEALESDGWNIKWLTPKEEGDEPKAILQVSADFGKYPPRIMLVTSQSKTRLDESSVSLLDWAEIKNVDLIIRPYNWTLYQGTPKEKSGVKAYVKSMYVTIVEDEFEKKYYDVPDSAVNTLPNDYAD